MSQAEPNLATEEWTVSGLRGRLGFGEPRFGLAEPVPAPAPDETPEPRFPTARGVLSKAEIEALLRPDLSDLDVVEPAARPVGDVTARGFELFEDVAEGGSALDVSRAQRIAGRLTAMMRRGEAAGLAFEAGVIGALSRDEGEGIVHFVMETEAGDVACVLGMEVALVSAVLDVLCGAGPGQPPIKTSQLTLLSRRLLIAALAPVCQVMAQETGGALRLARIETEARFAQILSPEARTPRLGLKVEMGVVTGRAQLAWTVDAGNDVGGAAMALPMAPGPSGLLADLETQLVARIASLTVPVSRLATLAPGQTLLLGVPKDQPVQLVAGTGERARVIAEGDVGRRGRKMAIRLTRVRRG